MLIDSIKALHQQAHCIWLVPIDLGRGSNADHVQSTLLTLRLQLGYLPTTPLDEKGTLYLCWNFFSVFQVDEVVLTERKFF